MLKAQRRVSGLAVLARLPPLCGVGVFLNVTAANESKMAAAVSPSPGSMHHDVGLPHIV